MGLVLYNHAEVKKVFLTEYDEERTLAFLKKESHDDGVEYGRKIAAVEHVMILMESMNIQMDEAMDIFDIPEEERPDIIAEIENRKEL